MPLAKPLDSIAWVINQFAAGWIEHSNTKKSFRYSFEKKPPKPVENYIREKLGRDKFAEIVYLITRRKIGLERGNVVTYSPVANKIIKSIL